MDVDVVVIASTVSLYNPDLSVYWYRHYCLFIGDAFSYTVY